MTPPAPRLWPLLLLLMGCAGSEPAPAGPPRPGADDPCAPGGALRSARRNVVATTATPDGQIIDWIPITSQTPDGKIASPPAPPASPGGAAPARSPAATAVQLGPRGPAGTVPVLRPRRPQCDCSPGYIQQADGSCAELASRCSGEGAMASGKSFTACCPELSRIPAMDRIDGQCVITAPDAHLCAKCGDGACGAGENDCNCPSDCHAPRPDHGGGPDGGVQGRDDLDGRSAPSTDAPRQERLSSSTTSPFSTTSIASPSRVMAETHLPSSELAALHARSPGGAAAEARPVDATTWHVSP
ncbi:hypothetical protein [Sorangium sp. So ce1335]|uniref:hypothetical protein n=1 Tax=Sorangium sp. So ce1335 TaxID=3133335 RepID=UPI003F6159D0